MHYPFSKTRSTLLQALITTACSSGFLLYGYDQGVFSGVIVTPYFLTTFNEPNATFLGLVNAIFDLGGALGGLSCFLWGNRFGRRKIVFAGCVISCVGTVLQATSKTIAQLLVGRIVTGVGVGELLSTIGMWQAETAQAQHRGALMSVELTMCALGLFLSQWINYGLGSNNEALAFTFPILFQLVYLSVTMLLVPALPESPRWLVSKGRLEEAKAVLVRLGDSSITEESESVKQKMIEMEEMVALEELEGWEYWKSLIHSGPTQNGKRVLLAVGCFSAGQLTGINSVTYYVPTLLIKFIKVPRASALWIGGLISVISVISSFLPVFTLERYGRIRSQVNGAIGQAICFFVIAGIYANLPPSDDPRAKPMGIAMVSFVYIYFAIFSSHFLGPTFVYGAEILPLKGRANGMGLGIIASWLWNFMIVMVTPPALENITWRFYVIFGCMNVVIAVTMFFFFPETKGKSLEEIDLYFAERYHGGAELRQVEQEIRLRHRRAEGISENTTPPSEILEILEIAEKV